MSATINLAKNTPTVLEEAAELTSGDRQRDYDHPKINFERIAAFWRAHIKGKYGIDVPLDGEDVGWMQVNVKQARQMKTPKRDNLTDGCGYIRCLERIHAAEGKEGYAS